METGEPPEAPRRALLYTAVKNTGQAPPHTHTHTCAHALVHMYIHTSKQNGAILKSHRQYFLNEGEFKH